jgi:DNA repair protein RecN (Recombination protein N)
MAGSTPRSPRWNGPWWNWARRSRRWRRLRRWLVFNPAELEEAEERLFALRGLARKHGIVADDLERFGADLEARVAALDGGAEEIAGLKAAHKDAVAAWRGGGRPVEPCAGRGGDAARRRHGGRTGAAEAGARVFFHRLSPEADPGPTGPMP